MGLVALIHDYGGRYRILFEHLPTTIVIGGASVAFTGDPLHLSVALLFGWLMDGDHLFDYLIFVSRSSSRFSIKTFLQGRYFKESGRLILPLHSFEICVSLAVLGVAIDSQNHHWLFTAALAMAAHLVHDHLSHRPNPLGYFLLARYRNQFRTDWFCQSKTP